MSKAPLADLPYRSIALVQSEFETSHAPSYDISLALREELAPWKVEIYSDRTIHALLDALYQFDCVVVGYNAVEKSPEIADALRSHPLRTNLVLLHQLHTPEMARFTGDLTIEFEDLDPPTNYVIHETLDIENEPLLNWPHPIDSATLETISAGGRAWRALVPKDTGLWNPILFSETAGPSRAVVARTLPASEPRACLCMIGVRRTSAPLLQLVTNMVVFSAFGQPDVVILEEEPRHRAGLFERVAVQGIKAVTMQGSPIQSPNFSRWPLIASKAVLVSAEKARTDAARWHHFKEWKTKGGTIAMLGTDHSIRFEYGVSDDYWVLQRWVAWFSGSDPTKWHGKKGKHGSILATREVLRVLDDWLPASSGEDGEQTRKSLTEMMNIPPPRSWGSPASEHSSTPCTGYLDSIRALVLTRIGTDGSVEQSVAPTAAALDIHRLLDDRLLDNPEETQGWLQTCEDGFSLEERFDAARALGDVDMFRRACKELTPHEVDSPILLTRFWEAAAACRKSISADQLDVVHLSNASLPLLASSPVIAYEYIVARYLFDQAFPDHQSTGAANGDDVKAVGMALNRYSTLLPTHKPGFDSSQSSGPEFVSLEALALLAFFRKHGSVATNPLIPGGDGVSPSEFEAVVRREQSIRELLSTMERDLESARERNIDVSKEAARAGHFLGGGAIMLSVAFAVIAGMLIWPPQWISGIAVIVGALGMVTVLATVLAWAKLCPVWLGKVSDLASLLANRFSSPAEKIQGR